MVNPDVEVHIVRTQDDLLFVHDAEKSVSIILLIITKMPLHLHRRIFTFFLISYFIVSIRNIQTQLKKKYSPISQIKIKKNGRLCVSKV
jgi:hypothetical protein